MKMKNPGESPASQKRKKAGQLRPSATVSSHKKSGIFCLFPRRSMFGFIKNKIKNTKKTVKIISSSPVQQKPKYFTLKKNNNIKNPNFARISVLYNLTTFSQTQTGALVP
jgi:hypothetical protein